MKTQVIINRWNSENKVEKDDWKNLISALVLAGYEVYGDNEEIVFTLGWNDNFKEINDN